MKIRLFLIAILCIGSLSSCEVPTTVNNQKPTSAIDSELNEAQDINQRSASNNLTQARNLFFQVSPRLLVIPSDVSAYQDLVTDVLPPMLSVANSLSINSNTDTNTLALKSDYQTLFDDSVAQLLRGINNNLKIYQAFIESPQSLDGVGSVTATQALTELAQIFQVTEFSEQYIAQLTQFPNLLNNGSQTLSGIRSQQTVAINGVLRISERIGSSDDLQQAYLTLVRSLTRVELLSQLAKLAKRAYGDERVALNQSELTPTQPNPNQIQMVVKESDGSYRFIRIENDRLVNEVRTDSRNLSAADLLNQSNVVVIREQSQQ